VIGVVKHWLLNAAVEFGVPLFYVFPAVSQALNVKPVPSCGSDDYATGLIDLFDGGMITFSSDVEGDDTRNRGSVLRMVERFRNLSKDDPALRAEGGLLKSYRLYRLPGMQVSFKLSNLGGEAWEQMAKPTWTRYVSASTVFPTSGTLTPADGELISADRDLVIAYMGWSREVGGEQIDLETVTWQTHADFEIAYWKRLPFVYHASFKVQPADSRWRNIEPNWFRDWRASTCSWHREPWNLPGWPAE
jgi:hypothetical protein